VLHDAEDSVIQYNRSGDLKDAVSKLEQRLAAGETRLAFEPVHGYLISLLQTLDVPASSQGLVFSKTSLNTDRVSPRTPRAVYFNDDVYVSWVPGGDAIDISAIDPNKGPIFYRLGQTATSAPRFERRAECTGCHLGPKTLNVPGFLLRSVITAPDGTALSQVDRFTIGHNGAFDQRWGGWYVTAVNDSIVHMGNVVASTRDRPLQVRPVGSLPDLRKRIDTSLYLAPGSDLVALMVLAHQVKMHNLITRANYETRYALADDAAAGQPGTSLSERSKQRIAQVAEPLLEYMLFRDEVPLPGAIQGSSSFAQDFERSGPRDSKGRSLHQLDLHTRLFRYPCSYLIYSPAFDRLPPQLRSYLWSRLGAILEGRDKTGVYAGMSAEDRQAIREILRDTKPEFAAH
jgi:hypothetical protein